MKAVRYVDERAPFEKCREEPDPGLRISPLMVAEGTRGERGLIDCKGCDVRAECSASVIRRGRFALAECNAAAQSVVVPAHYNRAERYWEVLARGAPMTSADLAVALGVSMETARWHLERWVRAGRAVKWRGPVRRPITYLYAPADAFATCDSAHSPAL